MSIRIMTAAAIVAVAGATGASAAFQNGDIIFVDTPNDTVNIYRAASGTTETLYQFNDPNNTIRLAGITRVNGRFYVNSGFASPSTPSEAAIFELRKLFGNTVESTLASSNPLLNPIGIAYHRGSDRLLSVNNPGPGSQPDEGIIGTRISDGDVKLSFAENPADPQPRYQAGLRITRDPGNADQFFAVTANGGVLDGPGDEGKGSVLHRITVDANGDATQAAIYDFSATPFGPVTFLRGVAAVGSDVYVTDSFTGGIYRIALDANGDFDSISLVIDNLGAEPGELQYNQYTNKLVFGMNDNTINQVNLDGTGFETLVMGVAPRGMYIIPTPGGVALLGLAGLAIARRRR